MVIEIEQLSFSKGEEELISIPECSFQTGNKYLLSGPTGCGKSTFAKWLTGWSLDYVNVHFSRGKIGNDIYLGKSSFLESFVREFHPLYLLQDAYTIFNPYQSVGRHFRDVWRNQSDVSPFADLEEVFECLKRIGIEPSTSFLRRKINQVSQGEAQRLALVLSLIRPSRFLILDEIFANVDKRYSESMMEMLSEWQLRVPMNILFISHDIPFFSPYVSFHYSVKNKRLSPEQVSVSFLSEPDNKIHTYQDSLLEIKNLKVFSPDEQKNPGEILWTMEEFFCRKGERIGLSGISGIGKSTFLLGLMGERRINWSKIWVNGKEWEPQNQSFRLPLDIRYLLQSVVSGFNPVKTIGTSLREIQKVRKTSYNEIELLLNEFDLDHLLLQKYPEEVSGGEIQRFGVLFLLLGNPDLILFDESFSSVDTETRNKIWQVILQQQKFKKFSVIVVSHDVKWLDSVMDRRLEVTN